MRILFDNQIFSDQPYGGVSRYFHELTAELSKTENSGVSVVVPRIYSEDEKGFLKHESLSRLAPYRAFRKLKKRVQSLLNRRASIRMLKKGGFDIFHPTYYDPYFLPYLDGKPFVLTIYDMIHEMFPQYLGASNETSKRKALLAEKAARIIAISENTKSDIVRILGIDPGKVEVIHLATAPVQNTASVEVPGAYILFVGNRGRYKNFIIVARAFAALMSTHPDLHLVCAGRDFTPEESSMLDAFGISSRCLQMKVDSAQLGSLYSRAKAFVFPSEYEGFGLPILEAFSYSCPVILSRASCFPEIAGDAALYFETTDTHGLQGCMETLLESNQKRQELIIKGAERLKLFSWKATAAKTLALYERVLRS